MLHDYKYFVYMLNSSSRRVLYTGVTNALTTRVLEHRRAENAKSFTAQYRAFRLVYYEEFGDVRAVIAREKQIKRMDSRKKECIGGIDESKVAGPDFRMGKQIRIGVSARWTDTKSRSKSNPNRNHKVPSTSLRAKPRPQDDTVWWSGRRSSTPRQDGDFYLDELIVNLLLDILRP